MKECSAILNKNKCKILIMTKHCILDKRKEKKTKEKHSATSQKIHICLKCLLDHSQIKCYML